MVGLQVELFINSQEISKPFRNADHRIAGDHPGFVPGVDGTMPSLVAACFREVGITVQWFCPGDDLK
jgi:hypothetical protein